MALAHINNRVQGGGTGTSFTIVAPNTGSVAHTAGNGLVALIDISFGGGGVVTSITNTAGDNANWTKLGSFDDATIFNRYEIWYVNSTLGHASDVVTVNLSVSTTFRALVVHEISGQNAAGMAGATSTGTGSSMALATGTVAVTAAEEIIFAIMAGLGKPISAGSGYALTNFNLDGTNNYYGDEYKIVTASEAATASQLSSNTWAIFAGSFKASAAGAVVHRLASLGVGA